MIAIEGLNRRQRMLADIIWALDSKDQVLSFISTLPLKDRLEAEVVVEMMIWAYIDEVETIDPAIRKVIDKIAQL